MTLNSTKDGPLGREGPAPGGPVPVAGGGGREVPSTASLAGGMAVVAAMSSAMSSTAQIRPSAGRLTNT